MYVRLIDNSKNIPKLTDAEHIYVYLDIQRINSLPAMYCTHTSDSKPVLLVRYLLVTLLSMGCYSVLGQVKGKESFSLIGQLPVSSKGNVYLFNQDGKQILSSTIKGAQFILKGSIPEPALYSIQIDTLSRRYPVFLEGSSIQIRVQSDGTHEVKGSELHIQWAQYNNHIDQVREQLISLYQQRSVAQQKGDTILFNKLRLQNDSISIRYGTYQRAQIAQKPYTYFNLFLLMQANMGESYTINMLNEFRPSLAMYPGFQAFEHELKRKMDLKQAIAVGQVAYTFTLPDSTGTNQSLQSLQQNNKLILLDFWASWCGPCIKEFPALKAINEEYTGKGLVIVGISLDNDTSQWIKALGKYTPAGVQLLSTDKNIVLDKYVITSIPQLFLIDRNGIIQANSLQGDQLSKKIAELLLENK